MEEQLLTKRNTLNFCQKETQQPTEVEFTKEAYEESA
jgi:hypothetical protein